LYSVAGAGAESDLIVMGTHGRRGYDRFVLGSVTNRVMRKTPCPVLAVCKAPQEPASADIGAREARGHRLTEFFSARIFRRIQSGL